MLLFLFLSVFFAKWDKIFAKRKESWAKGTGNI
jgi:hypothetical protein